MNNFETPLPPELLSLYFPESVADLILEYEKDWFRDWKAEWDDYIPSWISKWSSPGLYSSSAGVAELRAEITFQREHRREVQNRLLKFQQRSNKRQETVYLRQIKECA